MMRSPIKPLPALIIALSAILLSSATVYGREDAEMELRQHLVSFYQRNGRFEDLPENHPLRPLAVTHLTAMTSYLLLQGDEASLLRFYPQISSNVLSRLSRESLTEAGLLPGAIGADGEEGIYLSPALNALAGLELHSLHLIAFRTGQFEEAFDLLTWSRMLAEMTTRSFYDPSRSYFFPVDESGYMKIRYKGAQALPLLLDRILGGGARRRIVEKLQSPELAQQLWGAAGYDLLQPAASYLLSHGGEVKSLGAGASQPPTAEKSLWNTLWLEFPEAEHGLFPPWHPIASLVLLISILNRESLMEPDNFASLSGDVDSLIGFLRPGAPELDAYVRSIQMVNELLGAVSDFSKNLDSNRERWRAVNEHKWNRLSPRLKRIVIESARAAAEELRLVKPVLSERFMRDSNLYSNVSFPTRAISRARQFEFTASIHCRTDSLDISRLYIGAGEQRWKVTEDKPPVPLSPALEPFVYKGLVSLPPTTGPGILTLPVYLDFLVDGRRVELHHLESITLMKGYDVSLNFPAGKRLIGSSIALDIVLRHSPDRDTQGRVEGAFMKELSCSPGLPAKYVMKRGTDVTTLPLSVSFGNDLAPGRYPFSLRVFLEGDRIAFFEDVFVRPIRWFHLGPLAGRERLLDEGVTYQDDLFRSHSGPGGRPIEWREVPPGAIDGQGAVLPARLTGNAPQHCSLLYTVVDSPVKQKVAWGLTTKNTSSIWANGDPLMTASSSPYGDKRGKIDLRKGANSIFIASCWEDEPDCVHFTLSDESGLPVPGLSNDIDRIIEGFDRLAARQKEDKLKQEAKDKPLEVVLTLKRPDAREVCVIGSFNSWQPGATPMRRDPEGVWTARFFLPAGRYVYKFLVDGKVRIPDPNADQREPDGFGGMNSILVVR
jgi:hypothetical protein